MPDGFISHKFVPVDGETEAEAAVFMRRCWEFALLVPIAKDLEVPIVL